MKVLIAADAIAMSVAPVIAEQMPLDNIHALTCGVYELEEWHINWGDLKASASRGTLHFIERHHHDYSF